MPHSRQGFYAWLDSRMSACSNGRWPIAPLLWPIAAGGQPVVQFPASMRCPPEYIPTNVDEAEFDVNVTAPEGISLASMDKIMQTIEEKSVPCRWSV